MASNVHRPPQPLGSANFKASLVEFQRIVKLIVAQNKPDKSRTEAKQKEIISYSQFYNIVTTLFGHLVKPPEIKDYYRKITNHADAPTEWTELFGCFPSEENITADQDPENMIFYLPQRKTIKNASGAGKKKRDVIRCIVKVPILDAAVTVSKCGTISLYNSQEASCFVGCDFLNQLKRVIAVTERSIVLWDYMGCGKNKDNYVCMKPMEHCLLCICAVISQDQSLQDDVLVGDDAGFVSLYSISSDELKLQLSESSKMIHPNTLDSRKFRRFRRKLHDSWVVKIKYFPEINLFASCSPDGTHSLVLDEVKRIGDAGSIREFSVPKGVTTFAYCVKTNMIITGGRDKVLRLWHPNDTEKPMGKLFGHVFSIVDIAVNEKDQHIISLSTARGLRVWDIHTLSLLQVFLDTETGPCDMRINSMIFDNKHLQLITASCTLGVWPLTRMIQDTRQVPRSHDRPINAAGYNNVLHQFLTICSESVLKVWEMETGHQIYEIKDAHGPTIEVTAVAIHINGFRFATGAYNGSLKIWDFGNGYQIKALPPKKGSRDEEQGICQLSFLRAVDNQHVVIALDLSGNIKLIQGKEDDPTLFVTMKFNEDIGVWYRTVEPVPNKPVGRAKRLPPIKIPFDPKLGRVTRQQTKSHRRMIVCFDAFSMENYTIIVTGSLCGEINTYSLDPSAAQLVCSRKVEDDILSSTVPGNTKARRINSVLLLLPANVGALKTLNTSSAFQDTSTCKKDGNPADISSADEEERLEKDSPSINSKSVTPLIVSGHENGRLYVWNAQGDLLTNVLPYTKHPPISLTALCANKSSSIIIAGNREGYIIIWRLLNSKESYQQGSETIKQDLCWRAHTLKITSLCYEDSTSIVVSASADGSIRLWHASNGHYIGYFGQKRVFELTNQKEFILPCDIVEMPVEARSEAYILAKKNYEYPLIYDRKGFRSKPKLDPTMNEEIISGSTLGMKYFEDLISPKFKRGPLEKFTSAGTESGGIFRTMPIYKLQSITLPPLPYELQNSDSRIDRENSKVIKKVSHLRSHLGAKDVKSTKTRFPPIQAKQ
ncbi:WD repeat-containing protein 64 [Eleutherodactylus coqui]|uniref:WD repeat-containing protein 64 n=1 Tax=Eleutherodactylus coqui TaxID=57060 RepID=UPI0034637AE3